MPIWKRGEVFYGYVRVNGLTSARKSTGCHDKQAAEKVLLQWERELADPAHAAAQKASLDDACDRLLKEYQALVLVKKKSAATEDYYADKLGTVARILGPKLRLAEIASSVVDGYIAARRKEEASENTIGKELDALKVVLRHAKRAGRWAGDIEAIFPMFSKGYKPRKRALSASEVKVLLQEMPPDLAAQMAFAIATSAEAKCILEAQRVDVMEEGKFVLLRGTKRELRQRTVPIVARWQKELLAFALENAEGEAPYLFKRTTWGLRQALRRTCKRLGFEHASPNDLRRTFAVGMREAGVPLELISPQMGHADTRMIERVYGRLSPQQLGNRVEMALNGRASERTVDTTEADGSGQIRTATDDALRGKVAPRAGFEPATHGLTVPDMGLEYTGLA